MPIEEKRTPPGWAEARGPYRLDEAVDVLNRQWRSGQQIVVLAGAGISVQSGFPALGSLSASLLMTYALHERTLYVPGSGREITPTAPAFSMERDGWFPPCLSPEFYGLDQLRVIRELIQDRLGADVTVINPGQSNLDYWPISTLNDFAKGPLGLDWFNLLDLIAENRPDLVESLFDALGANVKPGAAHNLLAQFVTWFNVRLVLTTNFDKLIETSLRSEAQVPYIFDVHIEAPPPSPNLVRKHLSIIKLHGSHYGIRADRTINTPLDQGHLNTLLRYFDEKAVLVVLDYSGNDARFMGLMRALMLQEGTARRIVRVDAIASAVGSPFWKLATEMRQLGMDDSRLIDLYYPHSRLFLLDVFQKCSGKLPNTRTEFSIIPHTPAPFKLDVTFGNSPSYPWLETADAAETHPRIGGIAAWAVANAINGVRDWSSPRGDAPYRFGVVTGNVGCGVSQFLSQVAELLFKTHQHLWCDLDEAVSVGTLVSWLYEFVLNRQPDFPTGPLPLDLPPVDSGTKDLGVRALARTAAALWNRLKRDRYLIVIDSVSYALSDLLDADDGIQGSVDPRLAREAKRLLLFLSMLAWFANRDGDDSQCVLLIGTHVPEDLRNTSLSLEKLVSECQHAVCGVTEADVLRELHPEAKWEEINPLIQMIVGTKQLKGQPASHNKKLIGLSATENYTCAVWPAEEYALFGVVSKKGGGAVMHRVFVQVTKPDDIYTYKADGRDGSEIPLGNAQGMLGALLTNYDQKPAWANPETDERYVDNNGLVAFLAEAALCNRPRSWAQLLALPIVENLARHISDADGVSSDGYDPSTRALRSLVDLSLRCGALRVQPGAFYYMDGLLRKALRSAIRDGAYSGPAAPAQVPAEFLSRKGAGEVHRKMLRYYERVYNLSGDVTAINYFYYHTCEYLQCVHEDEDSVRAGLEELGRGLLENSVQARGHLNAYDHAYLLLRLLRIMPPENGGASAVSLQPLIYKALSTIYEDADDPLGSESIASKRKEGGEFAASGLIGTIEWWHQRQKIHAQNLDLYRSCAAGLVGLVVACGKGLPGIRRGRLELIAEAPSGSVVDQADVDLIERSICKVCDGFAASNRPNLRSQLVNQNWPNRRVPPSIHRTILRLARTILRLCRFSGSRLLNFDDAPRQMDKLTINLISAGKMLLASCADQDSVDTKLLWTLYHCTRAQASLYSTTTATYLRNRFAKDLYRVGLAKSYAIRAGGLEGVGAEGFASLHESEVLIWEARMLMASEQWPEALARQQAAVRELAEARSKLVRGRASLVRWRELTILLAGVSVDTVKLRYCEAMPQLNTVVELNTILASGSRPLSPEEEIKYTRASRDVLRVVTESAEELENLGAQLIFQIPIIWNDDPWMEIRLWFQVQRMVFYAWGTLSWALELCSDQHWAPEALASIVIASNHCLRALRLVGGYDTKIPTLPDAKAAKDPRSGGDPDMSEKNWEVSVATGLEKLWDRVHGRVRGTKPMESSGVFEYSIAKIKEVSRNLYKSMLPTNHEAGKLPWRKIDKSTWLVHCARQSSSFGHGDV